MQCITVNATETDTAALTGMHCKEEFFKLNNLFTIDIEILKAY